MRALILSDGIDLQLHDGGDWTFYTWDDLRDETRDRWVTLPCGCRVAPNGVCDHGNEAPLLVAGLVE